MKFLAFEGSNAFSHIEQLAVKIGPRHAGSAGEHAAARYIAAHFRSLKLATRMQRYPVVTFEMDRCRFEVGSGKTWREVDCQPVMLSRNTPARGLEGELYFAENGEEEHLSPAMKDRIVLVCGRIRAEHFPRFLSYGPKALVIIEPALTDEPIRINFLDHNRSLFGNLPAIRIRHLDGLDLVKEGLSRGRLLLRTRERKSHSFNVIAEKPGTETPDEIVLICGHYDSSMGITGASDNAGGTALVLELARALAKESSRRTLRFVAFSAEETGLNGSLHYARDLFAKDGRDRKRRTFEPKVHRTEMEKHRLCVNLDVHGAVLGRNECHYSGESILGSAVKLLAKETGTVVDVAAKPMSSDGTCLAALKIPTIQLARYGGTTDYLHSLGDDIRHLSPEALALCGRFTERFLRRYVLDAAAFPFERKVPDEQLKKIDRYFTEGLKTTPPGEKEEKKKAPPKKRAARKTAAKRTVAGRTAEKKGSVKGSARKGRTP